MGRRKSLIASAAELPPGVRIPDELLFAEGFEPTDTLILELVQAAPRGAFNQNPKSK